MIGFIKDFFFDRKAAPRDPQGHSAHERHLAAAALLVEVAAVDSTFDSSERHRIILFARDRLGLDADEASDLVDAASAEVEDSAQLYAFTRAIVEGFSYEERVTLMQILWEVALADGTLDPFEDQVLRRVSGLIHVTDRDRGTARKRAEAALRSG